MKSFIESEDRSQSTLFPEHLDDYVGEDNPVRVVDVFVDELDLGDLGFGRVIPQDTGRLGYHPCVLLKLYIYGYLNRVQSSRRLEREAGRNVEVMWLTGRLAPDHKTIAEFRKDNGRAIRKVCAQFVALCRRLDLFSDAGVAIDGAKFKAVNARDKNFTRAKVKRRMAQIEESVARYLDQLDSADRQEPSLARTTKTRRLTEKRATLKEEMRRLGKLDARMLATPDQQISLSDPDARSMATSGRAAAWSATMAAAVDIEYHLIPAHEATNVGTDRSQLSHMAKRPRRLSRQTSWKSLPIADTSKAKRFWPAKSRHYGHPAQTANLGHQGQGSIWQAGLCLHRPRRCLSLPCRRTPRLALHKPREWSDVASLLDHGLSHPAPSRINAPRTSSAGLPAGSTNSSWSCPEAARRTPGKDAPTARNS